MRTVLLALTAVFLGLAARGREFVQPPVTGQVHASTFETLANGDIVAAWFGGTKEGAGDGAQATRYVFRLGDYNAYGRCLTFGSGRQVYGVPYSVTKIGYYDTGKAEMTVSVAYNKEGNAHTVTRMLVNCADVTDYGSSTHPGWYQDAATPVLGAAWGGGTMFLGPIFSMRGYSRPLEIAEAAYNTHLDQARFGLCGNVHVIGVPREFGSPSLA